MAKLPQKKIAILVEEMYQEMEVWYPIYRLKEEGATVKILGTGAKEYKSKHGYPIQSDADIHEEKSADFDGVIVPGGFAPDFMRRHKGPVQFVREIFDEGKLVAAICHGLWIPASAGILKNRRSTCFFAIKDDIIHSGATYVDQEVCVDQNLISSRKPEDLPAFMREIIRFLTHTG